MATNSFTLRAGDWECMGCEHVNFKSREYCQKCGREGFKLRTYMLTVVAKPGDWMCSRCSKLNFANRFSCKKCGALKFNNVFRVAV